jgi:hypothetical protein
VVVVVVVVVVGVVGVVAGCCDCIADNAQLGRKVHPLPCTRLLLLPVPTAAASATAAHVTYRHTILGSGFMLTAQ